jgi:hypothetical protein
MARACGPTDDVAGAASNPPRVASGWRRSQPSRSSHVRGPSVGGGSVFGVMLVVEKREQSSAAELPTDGTGHRLKGRG